MSKVGKKSGTDYSKVVRRSERRVVGVFIDGVGLDRAARRLNRKVDFAKLVKGVCSGLKPIVTRYYTIIPNEDDARQLSFLDAAHRSGLDIVVKRLPPKNVTKQVTIEIEMAADILAFAAGLNEFAPATGYLPEEFERARELLGESMTQRSDSSSQSEPSEDLADIKDAKRIITVICPSRDTAYPIALARELGADTVAADFASGGNVLKAASNWIDLSTSETIWMD